LTAFSEVRGMMNFGQEVPAVGKAAGHCTSSVVLQKV